MKAVTCRDAELELADLPDPQPGKGQMLLQVLRCGICGSDLHARHHCDELADVMNEIGYEDFMRSSQSVVFGHEFCGEVAEYGPGTRKPAPSGAHVVALPPVRRGEDVHALGLSTAAPGAYADVLHDQAQPLNGSCPLRVSHQRDRAGRAGRGELDDAKVLAGAVVDVDLESDALAIELLCRSMSVTGMTMSSNL